MSIYSVIAFNSAMNQMKQNAADAQNLESARTKTDMDQQELDIAKRTAEAKIKMANNAGQLNDYQTQNQMDILKKIHGAMNDHLEAQSDAQDLADHKIQTSTDQAKNVATTHAQDPDVQTHIGNLLAGMNGQAQAPSFSAPGTTTPTNMPQGGLNLSGINAPATATAPVPAQPGAGQGAQVQAPAPTPVADAPAQAPSMVPNSMAQVQAQIKKQFGDLYMIDPTTGGLTVDPIAKSRMEREQGAEATVQANQANKDREFYSGRFDKMDHALDPAAYRAGAFGDAKKVFDRGSRLDQLGDIIKSYQDGNADSRQIEELAIGTQYMLAGGNSSVEQVRNLVPQSAWGNVQKLREWLTNNPTGTNQQKFVERTQQTIRREMATTQAQMDDTRLKRLSNFSDLQSADPDKYSDIVSKYGITPDKIQLWSSAERSRPGSGLQALINYHVNSDQPAKQESSGPAPKSQFSHLWGG